MFNQISHMLYLGHIVLMLELKEMNNICRYVFVEYGPMELDLNLRVRIDELEHVLADKVGYLENSIKASLLDFLSDCSINLTPAKD